MSEHQHQRASCADAGPHVHLVTRPVQLIGAWVIAGLPGAGLIATADPEVGERVAELLDRHGPPSASPAWMSVATPARRPSRPAPRSCGLPAGSPSAPPALHELRSWCTANHLPSGESECLFCDAAKTIETLRTMIDHPEVLAMLAGPGGSTCTKVVGDNRSEWFRRHWRNALDQWGWWHKRYVDATGDNRGRTVIEMEERRRA